MKKTVYVRTKDKDRFDKFVAKDLVRIYYGENNDYIRTQKHWYEVEHEIITVDIRGPGEISSFAEMLREYMPDQLIQDAIVHGEGLIKRIPK